MIDLAYTGKADEKTIKDSFADVLRGLFAEDPDVIYLDADLMNSMGTYKLSKEFPDRCIDCGIQEANMVGVAAGASALGKKPYVHLRPLCREKMLRPGVYFRGLCKKQCAHHRFRCRRDGSLQRRNPHAL